MKLLKILLSLFAFTCIAQAQTPSLNQIAQINSHEFKVFGLEIYDGPGTRLPTEFDAKLAIIRKLNIKDLKGFNKDYYVLEAYAATKDNRGNIMQLYNQVVYGEGNQLELQRLYNNPSKKFRDMYGLNIKSTKPNTTNTFHGTGRLKKQVILNSSLQYSNYFISRLGYDMTAAPQIHRVKLYDSAQSETPDMIDTNVYSVFARKGYGRGNNEEGLITMIVNSIYTNRNILRPSHAFVQKTKGSSLTYSTPTFGPGFLTNDFLTLKISDIHNIAGTLSIAEHREAKTRNFALSNNCPSNF